MDCTKLTDKDLLLSCFQDKEGAWNTFVNRFSKLIYHTIYQTLRTKNFSFDLQIMDDLYQEVFLALFKNKYKKLKQFKGKNNCSLASWLRLIASRTVIDFLRKQRNPVYLDDAVDDKKKVMETLADESDLPDKSLEKEEWYQIFKEIVQGLPPRDRYLFELSYSQELPDREVAQVMNLSISAVYMRKSRIKKKLQKVIEKKKIL